MGTSLAAAGPLPRCRTVNVGPYRPRSKKRDRRVANAIILLCQACSENHVHAHIHFSSGVKTCPANFTSSTDVNLCLSSECPTLLSAGFTASQLEWVNSQFSFDTNWDFSGAMRYSFEVITTIGYGAYAPQSSGAQAFVVVYAIGGLGVLGLQLGTLGEAVVMATALIFDLVGLITGKAKFSSKLDRRMLDCLDKVC